MTFVLQHLDRTTSEIRHVRMHALLNNIQSRNVRIEALHDELARDSLRSFEYATPVGSVEFVSAWAAYWKLPLSLSFPTYPNSLKSQLGRQVYLSKLSDVLCRKHGFIKPVQVKTFNGFCLSDSDMHSIEQRNILKTLDPGTMVWYSDEFQWAAEWRIYVQNKSVIGVARYDPNEDDLQWTGAYNADVMKWVEQCDIEHPYAMDVGIDKKGVLRLVECNDAWALGLYEGMAVPAYIGMLEERWRYVLADMKPALDCGFNQC